MERGDREHPEMEARIGGLASDLANSWRAILQILGGRTSPLTSVPREASTHRHTTDQFATTEHIATTDEIAPKDQFATTDQIAPTDQFATTDQIAPTDQIATTDEIANGTTISHRREWFTGR